jgi:hypothetical protein
LTVISPVVVSVSDTPQAKRPTLIKAAALSLIKRTVVQRANEGKRGEARDMRESRALKSIQPESSI